MVPNFFPNLFYNKQGWVTNAKARVDFFIEKNTKIIACNFTIYFPLTKTRGKKQI